MPDQPHVVVRPNHETRGDRATVAAKVELALAQLFGDDQFSVETGYQSDWEPGEPCQECDHTILTVVETISNRYSSENGEFEYLKGGHAIGGDLVWVTCRECGNEEFVDPAANTIGIDSQ